MDTPPQDTPTERGAPARSGLRGSLRVVRVAGIDIGIHWTFWLLIAFLVFYTISRGGSAADAAQLVVFVFALFVCVVLHELGHALMARRFGVRTRDITLLPIGGMARLERMPERPVHELLIAVAGPAVNVVIAGVLLVLILALGIGLGTTPGQQTQKGVLPDMPFLWNLASVNIFLVLFNMLPAFPMDGGRVLRALLATQMSYARATDIAAKVGAVMAVLFVGLALFTGNLVLGLIAVFVFLGGQAENRAAQTKSALQGLFVSDAMVSEFRVLESEATLDDAVAALLAGSQQDFPVVRGGTLVGMLYRVALVRAMAEGHAGDRRIGQIMDDRGPTLSPDDPLQDAIGRLQDSRTTIPVLEGGRLVGILTSENVGELIMVRGAIAHAGR